MLDFWTTQYKSTTVTVPTQGTESSSQVQNSLLRWHQGKKGISDQNEYSKYLLAPVILEVIDPLGELNLHSRRLFQTLVL
jgi:hypothetical protein